MCVCVCCLDMYCVCCLCKLAELLECLMKYLIVFVPTVCILRLKSYQSELCLSSVWSQEEKVPIKDSGLTKLLKSSDKDFL